MLVNVVALCRAVVDKPLKKIQLPEPAQSVLWWVQSAFGSGVTVCLSDVDDDNRVTAEHSRCFQRMPSVSFTVYMLSWSQQLWSPRSVTVPTCFPSCRTQTNVSFESPGESCCDHVHALWTMELFRRSYGNANYRPQQHWHYSCSVIRDTQQPWSFVSRLVSRWNSWMMMMMAHGLPKD